MWGVAIGTSTTGAAGTGAGSGAGAGTICTPAKRASIRLSLTNGSSLLYDI
jgi:hypothetical protein